MITVSMSNEQKAILTIAPTSSVGNPALVDGVPSWTLEDPNGIMFPLVPSLDGMSCEAPSADGAIGTGAMVTVTADVDMGPGIETIVETFMFVVGHPKAVSLGATVMLVAK